MYIEFVSISSPDVPSEVTLPVKEASGELIGYVCLIHESLGVDDYIGKGDFSFLICKGGSIVSGVVGGKTACTFSLTILYSPMIFLPQGKFESESFCSTLICGLLGLDQVLSGSYFSSVFVLAELAESVFKFPSLLIGFT